MQFPDSKSVSLHFSIFCVLFNPYQAVVRFWSAPCHNGLAISCISCKCNPTLSGGIPRSCGIALWFLTLVQAARAQSYKMQQAFEPSAEGVGHMRSDKSSCLVQSMCIFSHLLYKVQAKVSSSTNGSGAKHPKNA